MASDCEAKILGTPKASALPSIGWKGRAFGFSCCQRVEQWFFRVVKELNNENRWRVPDQLIGSCRNKVQVYRSVRMPQLHTSLHFHLTPIVMINGSSRRDLLLNSQNFCRSTPAGAENPSPSWLCYRRLWGSRNRRALILGWAYYLDAFSSYPLRTWLPSVYRGHDNWYTRGASFPVLSY